MSPERAIQRQILKELTALGLYAVHTPNGAVLAGDAKRRAIQVNTLKNDGLKIGFPDLTIYNSQGRVGHIEVKAGKNEQSTAQLDCQAILEGMGHKYAVCRSVDDMRAALADWGWLS